MSTPRWPVVLFDLDGTLVDTVPLIVASYQHAFRTVLGRDQDEAEIRSWIGQPLMRAFRAVDEMRAQELYDTYTTWNADNTERLIASFAGVPDLLRDLAAAGVRTGVATSKRRTSARMAMRLTGIEDLTDLLVCAEDTDAHKPDPAPLLLAAQRCGVEDIRADRVAYVGDAGVDVLAGRAAGLGTVAVTWGAGTVEALREAGPDETASDLAALRRILLS